MKKVALIVIVIGVLVAVGVGYYYFRPAAPDIDPSRLIESAATAPDQLKAQISSIADAIRSGQYRQAYEALEKLESEIWLVEGASEEVITKIAAEVSYLREEVGKKLGIKTEAGLTDTTGPSKKVGQGTNQPESESLESRSTTNAAQPAPAKTTQ